MRITHKLLSHVTASSFPDPSHLGKGLGLDKLPPLRNTHMTEAAYYACIVYVRIVSCPDRPARTRKDGLGTLVDFLGTPARFGMVQSDCRISLITQLSRSNSRVTATQTPPPGHDTMRSSRITRLLLKCACA